MRILLERYPSEEKQTLGNLYLLNRNNSVIQKWKSLELPWKNNQNYISCIPTGEYTAVKHISPKFGECFWLQDVPNRSEILIHKGNFHYDILGCILIGKDFTDINKDNLLDVTSSGLSINELISYIPHSNIKVTINRLGF